MPLQLELVNASTAHDGRTRVIPIPLTSGATVSIGRSVTNAVMLRSIPPMNGGDVISQHHAVVRLSADGNLSLKDTSTNGCVCSTWPDRRLGTER